MFFGYTFYILVIFTNPPPPKLLATKNIQNNFFCIFNLAFIKEGLHKAQ